MALVSAQEPGVLPDGALGGDGPGMAGLSQCEIREARGLLQEEGSEVVVLPSGDPDCRVSSTTCNRRCRVRSWEALNRPGNFSSSHSIIVVALSLPAA